VDVLHNFTNELSAKNNLVVKKSLNKVRKNDKQTKIVSREHDELETIT